MTTSHRHTQHTASARSAMSTRTGVGDECATLQWCWRRIWNNAIADVGIVVSWPNACFDLNGYLKCDSHR